MADKRGRDVLRSLDPVDWGPADLGLRVLKPRASAEFAPRSGVPVGPAPLLATWFTAAGERVDRSAFADGDTVDGLTFDEAYAIAEGNTRAEPFTAQPLDGVRGVGIVRPYAATLLAVPDVLLAFAEDLDGELLVAAPTPQSLLLFGSTQQDLDVALRRVMATMIGAGPAGLSPIVYRVAAAGEASGIAPWTSEDPVLHPLVERARQLQIERYYGPMLQYDDIGRYTFRGRGAACARPQWSVGADGGIRSYAVWSPNMHPVVLPPVDWIAVNLKGPRAAPQRWLRRDELARVAGVELTATAEFGLPVDVVEWPRRREDRDGAELTAALRHAGARSTAVMGGMGESVHILDLVR
ncbi:DUF1444 domain-containing protein [Microbacterium tumbae]